jgi:hypothetical protein
MVAKTMVEGLCEHCTQRQSCPAIYEELGNRTGPSVASKVIAAFLLPIVVFIASLAAFEHMLKAAIEAKQVRTAVNFLLALSVTVGLIVLAQAVSRQSEKTD